MSRKKDRPIGDIESRIKSIDLRVEAFEQLARDFNLVIEPVRLPEPERIVAVAVVEAPPPPPPPPPPPVIVEEPEVVVASEPAPSPTPSPAPVIEQIPLPKAPVRPAPPVEPRAKWVVVAVSILLAALAGGSWYALQAVQGWQAQRAHQVFPLAFGNATLLAVKGWRADTVDSKRGLLFTLEGFELATKRIQKFSDAELGGLAWGQDCLWTTVPNEGWVLQRESATGARVRKVFELPDARPTAIAWDGREVWVFDSRERRLHQYAIGEKLANVRDWPLEGEPAGLHVSDDLVWVAEASTRRIVRYKAGATLELFDTLDLGRWLPATSKVAGFAVDGGALWVLTEAPAEIHRLELALLSRGQVPGGRKQ